MKEFKVKLELLLVRDRPLNCQVLGYPGSPGSQIFEGDTEGFQNIRVKYSVTGTNPARRIEYIGRSIVSTQTCQTKGSPKNNIIRQAKHTN
jgi:hypothetical protein